MSESSSNSNDEPPEQDGPGGNGGEPAPLGVQQVDEDSSSEVS